MSAVIPRGASSGRTTRVRGLAPWQPQSATRQLLDIVRIVLVEYAAYLPMTLRQVFYRLVGAHGYPKSEQAYARLGEHLNRARRAGMISFDAIRDDDSDIRTRIGWSGPGELIDTWRADVQDFRLDRPQGQQRRYLVMVETHGMKPQIETVANDYGVPVIGSGGFDSLTAKHQLAGLLGRYRGSTEILHIGDHDPSGQHLYLSLADDVTALIEDGRLPGVVVFTRLAVTPAHIDAFGLPAAPPKATDRRSFIGDTVQAEAIPPDVLARIVRDALESRIDRQVFSDVLVREQRTRKLLSSRIQTLIEVTEYDGEQADDGERP